MSDEDIVQEMFAHRVSNSLEWFGRSRALFAAARATRERSSMLVDLSAQMDLERVIALLCGFGLECLFKAIIVHAEFGNIHAEDYVPKAEFPKKLSTHDLCKLAEMVDADLPKQHGRALEYLTTATVWMGRYPSSKSGNEGTIIVDMNCYDEAEEIYRKYARPFSISV